MTSTPTLAEVIALSEKATQGEFLVNDSTVYALKHHSFRRGIEQFENATYAGFAGDNSESDAAFIAALVNWFRTSAASLRDDEARDAARYRWLEQNADVEYTDEDGNGWIYSPTDSKLTSLSTRIDTAITATQPAAQERQA